MNEISIRDFRKNLATCLKELPLALTRNGIPIAVIIPPSKIEASTLSQSTQTSVYTPIKKKEDVYTKIQPLVEGFKMCQHGARIGLCKHGCKK